MTYFGLLDWSVLVAYFALVTWIGHRVSAQQSSIQEYFLGSRSLPWYAVSASIISTTVSGVTFIGVPALVFAEGGDYRYLQFVFAGFLSKWIIGHWILPKLYVGQFASPYELIRDRLGNGFGQLASLLFFLGAILGQGVRVFAVALVLELLTGLSLEICIALIVGFSALHTWLGGIRAVVWTDALQFVIFVAGGLVAVIFAANAYPGGFSELVSVGATAGKFNVFDFNFDPTVSFTFWAGVFAMPFQNLAAYGSDQVNTQRMLCCRSLREARRALYVSNAGELVVVLFLTVGLGLWGYYQYQPIDPAFASLVAEKGDRIFPAFILSELPAGIKGLLVAGVFAAAMSSLDSVLAALAQTSLTMFHRGYLDGTLSEQRAVTLSRILVLGWAIALGGFALLLAGRDDGLIPLAFAMTAYTYGSMLGLFLMALFVPRRWIRYPALGVLASILSVLIADANSLAFPWLFPLGVLFCLGVALFPLGKSEKVVT
ncbi:MAG: sodium:solute symporter family transporter [Steroidobacteraceae bacterium]|jgi:SSS family solute:Na+ symporter